MKNANTNVPNRLIGNRARARLQRRVLIPLSMLTLWHIVGVASFRLIRPIQVQSSSSAQTRPESPPPSSDPLEFVATAYSEEGITKSGEWVHPGVVAADPRVLPLGSVIKLDVPGYSGMYRVLDTGLFIKGKRLDVYIPDEQEAIRFGRQSAKVVVIRYGPEDRKSLALLD